MCSKPSGFWVFLQEVFSLLLHSYFRLFISQDLWLAVDSRKFFLSLGPQPGFPHHIPSASFYDCLFFFLQLTLGQSGKTAGPQITLLSWFMRKILPMLEEMLNNRRICLSFVSFSESCSFQETINAPKQGLIVTVSALYLQCLAQSLAFRNCTINIKLVITSWAESLWGDKHSY